MKKSGVILGIFLLVIALVIIVLGIIVNNNGEYYINNNDELYDRAVQYLYEEDYQNWNPDHDQEAYHFFINYYPFGITRMGEYKYVYMWVLGESYYLDNNIPKVLGGYSMLFKFTFKKGEVVEYKNPKDGTEYTKSILDMTVDRIMAHRILNYSLNLSNENYVNKYYSKLLDSNNLELNDIKGDNDLLFSISATKNDCIPVNLSVFDNGKYVLATDYKACRPGVDCNLMLEYSKEITGTYNYDIMKIIRNSKNADFMTFTNEERSEYEIYTGNNKYVYMMITDKKNKYLKEFLDSINVDLHTCAKPDYK